jgi:hypothetical protein
MTTITKEPPKDPVDQVTEISMGGTTLLSIRIPISNPDDDSKSPNPTASPKKPRTPSFMDKFKFKRGRSNSSTKSQSLEDSKEEPEDSQQLNPRDSSSINQNEAFLNIEETPILELNDLIPVTFSVEQTPSMYVDTFRGKLFKIKSLDEDLMPVWINEWIVKVFYIPN